MDTIEKSKCFILDVDMILTDILFSANNEPDDEASFTAASNRDFTADEMKQLRETGMLHTPEFIDFFDRLNYDKITFRKNIDELLATIENEECNDFPIIILSHTTDKANIESKFELINHFISLISNTDRVIESHIINWRIPKSEFFKERYGHKYEPFMFIDDSITNCKQMVSEYPEVICAIPCDIIWTDALQKAVNNFIVIY